MSKSIAHIAVGLPLEGPFDYLVPEVLQSSIKPGMRVLISFARQKRIGIVVKLVAQSSIKKLNPILALLDESPALSPSFLKLAELFALRFGCSQGEAFFSFLPKALRTQKKLIVPPDWQEPVVPKSIPNMDLLFDEGQEKRWAHILERTQACLKKAKSVLVLVPDSYFVEEVKERLQPLKQEIVELSRTTDKKELDRWCQLRFESGHIVVGFISSIFVPLTDLGLVVIMDEENSSYKHDQSPFYHAREAAMLRASAQGCDVLFVSSAPSGELWRAVTQKKIGLIKCAEPLPPVKLLDRSHFKMKKGNWISPALTRHLEWAKNSRKTVLIYIQPSLSMQDVVDRLKMYFPQVRIGTYDVNSRALPKNVDVLVATTAIFRHKSKARFDMTAVLDIDREFYKQDYRAFHGAFVVVQYLRQMTKEFIFLQTLDASYEGLHALTQGYESVYKYDLSFRKDIGAPPFEHLVAIVLRSSDSNFACQEAKRLYDILREKAIDGIDVFEPQPDRTMVLRNKFRYCVMVKAKKLKALMVYIKENVNVFRRKKDIVLTINVDP